MFKRVKKNWNMLWPLLALTVVAVIIFLERMGVAENFLKGDQEIAQNERYRILYCLYPEGKAILLTLHQKWNRFWMICVNPMK